jgi:hypothetical protein
MHGRGGDSNAARWEPKPEEGQVGAAQPPRPDPAVTVANPTERRLQLSSPECASGLNGRARPVARRCAPYGTVVLARRSEVLGSKLDLRVVSVALRWFTHPQIASSSLFHVDRLRHAGEQTLSRPRYHVLRRGSRSKQRHKRAPATTFSGAFDDCRRRLRQLPGITNRGMRPIPTSFARTPSTYTKAIL